MIFALDWIQSVIDSFSIAISKLIAGLSYSSISSLFYLNDFILIFVIIAGLLLCFYGFKSHKLVNGVIGASILGFIGWNIGHVINNAVPSVSAIYTISLCIIGFFCIYLCYFVNVLLGAWLFATATLFPIQNILGGHVIWLSFLPAIIFCVFYIKFKLQMTAVSGAIILGLLVYPYSPALGMITALVCGILGIIVQLRLRKLHEIKLAKELEEQIAKYPYGPGLAYGWEDPTIAHIKKN